ncbi:putative DNA methyltransferase [Rubellimicrobium mesophilum DSM 19309]|uniref:Putative DNA methyltransferase n=1 Tax=Rubellimicrobium mesophilum DSM 19309 TaxID=442562 RepID=A0A017HP91_9RHOB|nr:putative DNA methyltransferase [Rubellimicrobium mesophilum DSM 19309]
MPLTAKPALFLKAAALGREVVWLHTYGERFADPAQGRPKTSPRMAPGTGPFIPAEGVIPDAPEPLPEEMRYDAATRRLHIGKGFVANVPPEVAGYEVSGRNVLERWFSYRRRDRSRPVIGDRRPPSPLDSIQPDHWLSGYTDDLFDLLHVLGRLVLLEPAQAALLEEVCKGPMLTAAALDGAGAFSAAPAGGKAMASDAAIGDLFG